MTPTRVRDLALVAVVVGVLSWLIFRQFYGDIPRLQWFTPVWLGILAVGEALYGRQLRARIRRDPGTEPVQPLVAARVLVLAKASAILGALMTGIWAGLLAYVLPELSYLTAAGSDAATGAVGVLCSVGLVAAGLWLEYCCRAPHRDDDSPHSGKS